jgi:hypothetical protein
VIFSREISPKFVLYLKTIIMKKLNLVIVGVAFFATIGFSQDLTQTDSVLASKENDSRLTESKHPQDSIVIDDVLLMVISGQITQAIKSLEESNDLLTDEQKFLKDSLVARFISKTEQYDNEDGLVGEIHSIYRDYWMKVLLSDSLYEQEKNNLHEKLRKIAFKRGGDFGEFTEDEYDELLEFLMSELEKENIHSILGTVSPHGDFIAWKTETEEVYEVVMPDSIVSVKVIWMDDYISYGWLGFATFDIITAGGWPADSVLYAMGSTYDTASEHFAVSYLAHETRHMQDLEMYPNMDGSELEYRAKLTELVLSRETTRTQVSDFDKMAVEGRSSSHAHGSYHVITRIIKLAEEGMDTEIVSIEDVSDESIRNCALVLLKESDKIIEQMNPEDVIQFLD